MPSANTYFVRAKQLATLALVPDKTYVGYVTAVNAQRSGIAIAQAAAAGAKKDVVEAVTNGPRAAWYLVLSAIAKARELAGK